MADLLGDFEKIGVQLILAGIPLLDGHPVREGLGEGVGFRVRESFGAIVIMEKKMDTAIVYRGYIGMG